MQLDFLFQYVQKDAALFDGSNNAGYFQGTFGYGNQPIEVLNRWKKAGDQPQFMLFTGTRPSNIFTSKSNFDNSDGTIVNADYLRLTNLSLSLDMPARWKSAAHLQQASIFLQAQNLFTITKYKGLDASTGSSTVLPPLRLITAGARITL